jgi:hypothetical protein
MLRPSRTILGAVPGSKGPISKSERKTKMAEIDIKDKIIQLLADNCSGSVFSIAQSRELFTIRSLIICKPASGTAAPRPRVLSGVEKTV